MLNHIATWLTSPHRRLSDPKSLNELREEWHARDDWPVRIRPGSASYRNVEANLMFINERLEMAIRPATLRLQSCR